MLELSTFPDYHSFGRRLILDRHRPTSFCRWRGPAVLTEIGVADCGRPTPPRGHQIGEQRGIKAFDGVAQHGTGHIDRVLLEETYE